MALKKLRSKKMLFYLGLFLVASCQGTGLSKRTLFDKLRENSTHGHDRTKNDQLYHGRLLIGKNTLLSVSVVAPEDSKNQLEDDTEYQADTAWEQSKKPFGQDHGLSKQKQDNAAVEQLLKMEPKVECTGSTMKLQLQGAVATPRSLLYVDRGSRLSPLPLLKLPPSCGYSVQSTQRELVLVAPYDGCFVSHEEDSYVLPLRWCDLPLKMSCPVMRQSSTNPPMVTCHAEGMVVKTEWTTVDTIKVKLAGHWEPLMTVSPKCGFSVVFHPEGVVISARYAPCLQKKDGMYTLELAGDGEIKISCPSLSAVESEPTKNPGKGSNHLKVPNTNVFPSSPPIDSSRQVTPYGQVHQPFYQYPIFPRSEPPPASKPAHVPQPEAPKGQVQQLFFPKPGSIKVPPETPTAAPKLPQPGHVYPQYYPYQYPFYLPPETNNQHGAEPTASSKQVFPQKPDDKPPVAQKPQQPEAPQGQVSQFFPPQTTKELNAAQNPYQPEIHQGQLHYPYYYSPYPQPAPEGKPATKPAAPQEQPKPEASKGQIPKPITPQTAKESTEEPITQQHYIPPGTFYFTHHHPFRQQKPTAFPEKTRPADSLGNKQTSAPQKPQQPPPQTAEKPGVAQKPQWPQTYQGHLFYPYHQTFYPQPGSENKPDTKPVVPPQQQKPYGPPHQVHQPVPPQEAEKPSAAPVPQQPEAPNGQVNQQFSPETPNKPPIPQQPYIPPGQIHHPYHYPFYTQAWPENKPATSGKPSATPEPQKPQLVPPQAAEKPPSALKPQHPETYQGQIFYPYHYPFYLQPGPDNKPVTKPEASPGQEHQPLPPQTVDKTTAVPVPQQPVDPKGQVNQPPQSAENPAAVPEHSPYYPSHYPYGYPFYFHPGPANQPTAFPKLATPEGQVSKEKPVQNESGVKSPQQPPVKTVPHESTSPQPNKGSALYCPQICPTGMLHCCVQIAFHQHFHHIMPVKDTHQVSPGLPFLPSAAYSGLDQSLGYIPSQLWPAEATASKTPTSAAASSLPLPPENKQPNQQSSHGNASVEGSHPPKSTNQQVMYPYFVPNSSPYWLYPTQNEVQQGSQHSQLPAYHPVASQPQTVSHDQANTKGQNGQLSTKKLTEPVTTILPSNNKFMNPEEPRYSQVQHERYGTPVFYHQLPIFNHHDVPSHFPQPQPSMASQHQQTAAVYSDPKGYVLLQHGPPGREMNTDGVYDANIMAQSLQKPQYPQNPEPQQEYAQYPQRPGKGQISIFPGTVNYVQRPEQPVSAPGAPQYSSLHQEPSFKPKYPGFWKPMSTRSPGKRSPLYVPTKAFQRWSSASDLPASGVNQPVRERGGNQTLS